MCMGYIEEMAKYKSKVLKDIDSEEAVKRGPVNMYIDKNLYKLFKEAIDPLPVSTVIERLMRDIVETEKKKK